MILAGIDGARADRDPQFLCIFNKRGNQSFLLESLAIFSKVILLAGFWIDNHFPVLDIKASLLQQINGLPGLVADIAAAIATGRVNSLVNTLPGICPRNGSKIFSSSADGKPDDANSELLK